MSGKQKYLVSTFLLFLLTTGMFFADIEKSSQEEFAVKNGGALRLAADKGSIVVSTHKLPAVKVTPSFWRKLIQRKKHEIGWRILI